MSNQSYIPWTGYYYEPAAIGRDALDVQELTSMVPEDCEHQWERRMLAFCIVAPKHDWDDYISISGTREDFDTVCAHHGVTFEELLRCIEDRTDTKPFVTINDDKVLTIYADGYRLGPLGDW